MTEETLSRRVGISSLWTVGTRLTIQLFGLVSMVLLSRWLGPAQMGLFEKTAIILAVLEMLSALGLETALVQRKSLERKHYDTAWTLNISRGIIMAILLWLLSLKADAWFQAPGISTLLPWIALMPLLNGFENTGMVDVRRSLNFSAEYKWMVGRRVAGFIIAISLAWYLKSVWALVCASLGTSVVSLILSFTLSAYRPRISLAGWLDLRKFVSWFFVYTTIVALSAKIDDILLLRFAAPVDVAYYRRAMDFAAIPSSEFAAPMVRALIPAMSHLQDAPDERRHLFVKFLSLAMLVTFPACMGLALMAEPLVRVLLGNPWLPTVWLLQVVAISGIMRAYQTCAESAFIAINRVDVHTKFSAAAMMWRIPMLSYGLIYHGTKGLALALVAAAIISLIINLFVHRAVGTLGFLDVWRSLWRILVALFAMISAVLLCKSALTLQVALIQLIVPSIIGATVYILVLWGLWRISGKPDSAEAMVFYQVQQRFKRIRD
jgi:lipopolysaccharide exporter